MTFAICYLLFLYLCNQFQFVIISNGLSFCKTSSYAAYLYIGLTENHRDTTENRHGCLSDVMEWECIWIDKRFWSEKWKIESIIDWLLIWRNPGLWIKLNEVYGVQRQTLLFLRIKAIISFMIGNLATAKQHEYPCTNGFMIQFQWLWLCKIFSIKSFNACISSITKNVFVAQDAFDLKTN